MRKIIYLLTTTLFFIASCSQDDDPQIITVHDTVTVKKTDTITKVVHDTVTIIEEPKIIGPKQDSAVIIIDYSDIQQLGIVDIIDNVSKDKPIIATKRTNQDGVATFIIKDSTIMNKKIAIKVSNKTSDKIICSIDTIAQFGDKMKFNISKEYNDIKIKSITLNSENKIKIEGTITTNRKLKQLVLKQFNSDLTYDLVLLDDDAKSKNETLLNSESFYEYRKAPTLSIDFATQFLDFDIYYLSWNETHAGGSGLMNIEIGGVRAQIGAYFSFSDWHNHTVADAKEQPMDVVIVPSEDGNEVIGLKKASTFHNSSVAEMANKNIRMLDSELKPCDQIGIGGYIITQNNLIMKMVSIEMGADYVATIGLIIMGSEELIGFNFE